MIHNIVHIEVIHDPFEQSVVFFQTSLPHTKLLIVKNRNLSSQQLIQNIIRLEFSS